MNHFEMNSPSQTTMNLPTIYCDARCLRTTQQLGLSHLLASTHTFGRLGEAERQSSVDSKWRLLMTIGKDIWVDFIDDRLSCRAELALEMTRLARRNQLLKKSAFWRFMEDLGVDDIEQRSPSMQQVLMLEAFEEMPIDRIDDLVDGQSNFFPNLSVYLMIVPDKKQEVIANPGDFRKEVPLTDEPFSAHPAKRPRKGGK